ncbi:hypothetical protein Asi02nite_61130 [Asanoa siamensis]|uniref:Mce-associated membrane protein n=1 Tax=Asanoa siamensis TaxID=926357 RepID=A0ABQ4CZ85_9ACTN|nr:hypothetical protein Asi02nite_61130 [Asanoa siamensis]
MALAIVVFAVVGVARAMSGPDDRSTGSAQPFETSTPPESSGSIEGDDGVVEPTAATLDPGPSLSPGARQPAAVAETFAKAWLNRTAKADAWHAALAAHATATLETKLEGVDPVVVPAERLTGQATVVPQGTGLAEVSFPVDSGILVLRLVVEKGRWLVDGVDWERG